VETVIETVDGCGMLHVFDWTGIDEIPAVLRGVFRGAPDTTIGWVAVNTIDRER
jgi:hypothetical protein